MHSGGSSMAKVVCQARAVFGITFQNKIRCIDL